MFKFQCSYHGTDASEEGLFTRLGHMFTRDSKSPVIIDELIEKIGKMDSSAKLKFMDNEIDFECIKSDLLMPAVEFVEIITAFTAENIDKIKKAEIDSVDSAAIYAELVETFNKQKTLLDKQIVKLAVIHDDSDEAMKKGYLIKDKTFKSAGISIDKIRDVAKRFKSKTSGNLAKLKDLRWSTVSKTIGEARKGAMGAFSIFNTYASLSQTLYKKLDYLLYYTNKLI